MKHKILLKAVDSVLEHNVNAACIFFLYQEKIPEKVSEKFKKK